MKIIFFMFLIALNVFSNSLKEYKDLNFIQLKKVDVNNYNVNEVDEYGETLLDYAVDSNNFDKVKLLLSNQNIFQITINKAFLHSTNLEILKLLLDNGADINFVDGYGILQQLNAQITYNGNAFTMLIHLLNNGANPNVYDDNGETALFNTYEALWKQEEVIKLLIKFGIDTEIKNKEGRTALQEAIIANNLKEVVYLIKAGANLYSLTDDSKDIFKLTECYEMKDLLKKNIVNYKVIDTIINSYQKNKNFNNIVLQLERNSIKTMLRYKPNYFTDAQYVSVLNDYAYFLSETDRYKEAIPILERVIELSPNRVVAYLNLGDCYYKDYKKSKKQSDKEKVVENYKKYVSLLKKDAKIPDRVKEILEIK